MSQSRPGSYRPLSCQVERPIPEELTQAAVLETLAENSVFAAYYANRKPGETTTLGDFIDYCNDPKHADALNNHDVQILLAYYAQDSEIAQYQVMDFENVEGEGNKICLAYPRSDGTTSYYFGFGGTDIDDWLDDGAGMFQESTPLQLEARAYFERLVEELGITKADEVDVGGHSKGANKSMYITMTSKYADLIDHCYAIDGQGFSNEAEQAWASHPEIYEERRSKIILLAGEQDPVHGLGNSIVRPENIYYVRYDEATILQKTGGETDLVSYHLHQYLFRFEWVPDESGDGGHLKFSAELQPQADGPGEVASGIYIVSQYLMLLPPEKREAAAGLLMCIVGYFLGTETFIGYAPTVGDILDGYEALCGLLAEHPELLERFFGDMLKDLMQSNEFEFTTTLKLLLAAFDMLSHFASYFRSRNERDSAARREKAAKAAVGHANEHPYVHIDTELMLDTGRRVMQLADQLGPELYNRLTGVINELSTIGGAGDALSANWSQVLSNLSLYQGLAHHANNLSRLGASMIAVANDFDMAEKEIASRLTKGGDA